MKVSLTSLLRLQRYHAGAVWIPRWGVGASSRFAAPVWTAVRCLGDNVGSTHSEQSIGSFTSRSSPTAARRKHRNSSYKQMGYPGTVENSSEHIDESEIANKLFQHAVNGTTKRLRDQFPAWTALINRSNNTIIGSNGDDSTDALSGSSLHLWTSQQIARAMYGLKDVELHDIPVAMNLASAIAGKMETSTAAQAFTAVDVAQFAMGLSKTNPAKNKASLPDVIKILKSLHVALQRCNEPLTDQAIGNIMYGLQWMSSETYEVRKLLVLLTERIRSGTNVRLNSDAAVSSLKKQQQPNPGLGIGGSSFNIMAALSQRVQNDALSLANEAIGQSLYGLKNMTTRHIEVRKFLDVMAAKIANSQAELNGQAIGNALYGLRGMSSGYSEVRAVLAALTNKIAASNQPLTAQNLANAVYGLKKMSSEHAEVRAVVAELSMKYAASNIANDDADSEFLCKHIGSALFGLQNMSADCVEVRQLLAQIAIKINGSTDAIDAMSIGNAMFGLRNMSSRHGEVRAVVETLTHKLRSVPAASAIDSKSPKKRPNGFYFDGVAVGNALYGLRSMSSAHKCVRELVSAMAEKMAASPVETCQMAGSNISGAIYGLQSMINDHTCVKELLMALRDKIAHSRDIYFAGQDVSMIMYGLQGMSDDDDVCVRQLMATIVEKINLQDNIQSSPTTPAQESSESNMSAHITKPTPLSKPSNNSSNSLQVYKTAMDMFSGQNIGNALYGFQNMGCSSVEVRSMLACLARRIYSSDAKMSEQNIGNALYGLRNMTEECYEVRVVLHALTSRILASHRQTPVFTREQNISLSVYGLNSMTISSEKSVLLPLVNVLADKIANSPEQCVLTSQAMGNALYGLRGLPSAYPEVRKLVAALALKLRQTRDYQGVLLGRHAAEAMYGLQSLDSTHCEVGELMSALADIIVKQPQAPTKEMNMDGMNMSMALFGLRNASSNSSALRALITALTHRLSAQTTPCSLDAQMLGNALNGLKHMDSHHAEVRSLLSLLTRMIQANNITSMSGYAIDMAVLGFANLHDEHVEVRELCRAFTETLTRAHGNIGMTEYDAKRVRNAIHSLPQFANSQHAEIREMMAVLNGIVATKGVK
jgi:hypothetical protein